MDVARPDKIAEETLAPDDATDVCLVDEIGKMECFSVKLLCGDAQPAGLRATRSPAKSQQSPSNWEGGFKR